MSRSEPFSLRTRRQPIVALSAETGIPLRDRHTAIGGATPGLEKDEAPLGGAIVATHYGNDPKNYTLSTHDAFHEGIVPRAR